MGKEKKGLAKMQKTPGPPCETTQARKASVMEPWDCGKNEGKVPASSLRMAEPGPGEEGSSGLREWNRRDR